MLSVFEAQLATMRDDQGGGEALVHVAAAAGQVPVLRYLQMPKVGTDFGVKTDMGLHGRNAGMSKWTRRRGEDPPRRCQGGLQHTE